ncbi:hypothetical protein BHM03_00031159 [Ensete ventricosum]|nr:hypothetical protein BHM03_00031159 [Ensete ventricosum]
MVGPPTLEHDTPTSAMSLGHVTMSPSRMHVGCRPGLGKVNWKIRSLDQPAAPLATGGMAEQTRWAYQPVAPLATRRQAHSDNRRLTARQNERDGPTNLQHLWRQGGWRRVRYCSDDMARIQRARLRSGKTCTARYIPVRQLTVRWGSVLFGGVRFGFGRWVPFDFVVDSCPSTVTTSTSATDRTNEISTDLPASSNPFLRSRSR